MSKKSLRFTSSAVCLWIFCSAGAFAAFGQAGLNATADPRNPALPDASSTLLECCIESVVCAGLAQ